MNCRQVTRLVSQAMDTRLSWYQRLGVRLHLVYCVWCRRYAAQLRFLRKSVSALSSDSDEDAGTARLTTEAKEQMRQSLRQALKEQGPSA